MDTQKYRALLQVVDSGSITEAASAMRYTQSAVSRMVADLEQRWGLTLLHRGKGGASPTNDARVLLPLMRSICNAEDDLEAQVNALIGLETGTLRIATFSSVATHWLPPIIKSLRAEHPGISCELLLGDYGQIEQWVAEGRADCGFTCIPASEALDAQVVGQDQFMAVLPQDHPLAGESLFPVEAFADEPFLLLTTGAEEVLARINAETDLNIAPTLSTFEDYAIMAMVESGMGLSILPSLILNRISYRLVVLPLSIPSYRDIWIITRKDAASPAFGQFRAHLARFLGA